jgi:hypothetical protein
VALSFHEEFERGSNGVALDSFNTSFGIITGSVVFTSSASVSGVLSARINNNTTTNRMYVSCSSLTTYYGRVYLYIASAPTAVWGLMYGASGSARKNDVYIDNNMKLRVSDGTSTTNGTVTLSSTTWYRIEWDVTGTTQVARLYDASTNTLLDTVSRAAQNTAIDSVSVGTDRIGGGTGTLYFDNVAWSDTAQPGNSQWISDNDSATFTDAASVTGDYSESFENGTSGNVMSTGTTNFGTVSGATDFKFDNVTKYTPLAGSQSGKMIMTGVGGYGMLNVPLGLTTYARWYMNMTVSGTNGAIFSTYSTVNGYGTQIGLSLGKLTVYNQTTTNTATTALTTSTWYRCELDATGSTYTFRYYVGESTTPVQTLTGSTNNVTFDRIYVGNNVGTVNALTVYFDGINGNGTFQPGPLQVSVSASDTGTFTDAVGALLISKSDTETGTFTDASTTRAAALTGAETGTLTDAVSTRATTLTRTETGTFTESQIVATQTLFDGDTFSGRESFGLEQVVRSTWRFTPSRTAEIFQMKDRATFFVTIGEGVSVLKTAGAYRTTMNPLPEDMQAADIVYLGGRSYAVDDTEKAALIAAGYGAYVTLIPDPS